MPTAVDTTTTAADVTGMRIAHRAMTIDLARLTDAARSVADDRGGRADARAAGLARWQGGEGPWRRLSPPAARRAHTGSSASTTPASWPAVRHSCIGSTPA